MNKRLLSYLLRAIPLGALACAPAVCAAQTPFPSTYRDAIALALANRAELAIEQANVRRSSASVGEAKGAFLPTVELYSAFDHVKTYDTFPGIALTAQYGGQTIPINVKAVTPAYQINSAIEVKYSLYSGGRDEARLADARATDTAVQAQQALTKRNVILEVTLAYWGLQKKQILHQIAQRKLDYAREDLNVAVEQHNKGGIARIELDIKNMVADTREMELRSAARTLADAQRRYAYALGLDIAGTAAPALLGDEPDEMQIDYLIGNAALISEPEKKIAEAELAGAKARVGQVRAEYKPSVELYANYKQTGRSEDNFGGSASDMHRGNASIGVRLRWNLYDGFRTDHRMTQAVATSEQMQLRMEQTRRQIENDVAEKQERERDMRDQLQLARKQTELAKNQLLIAKKRWETNLISSLQYRAIQLALEEAKSKERTAQTDSLLAQVALRLARGG